jgi:uncharacterized membrane protein YfbV (UPF0208 family)
MAAVPFPILLALAVVFVCRLTLQICYGTRASPRQVIAAELVLSLAMAALFGLGAWYILDAERWLPGCLFALFALYYAASAQRPFRWLWE